MLLCWLLCHQTFGVRIPDSDYHIILSFWDLMFACCVLYLASYDLRFIVSIIYFSCCRFDIATFGLVVLCYSSMVTYADVVVHSVRLQFNDSYIWILVYGLRVMSSRLHVLLCNVKLCSFIVTVFYRRFSFSSFLFSVCTWRWRQYEFWFATYAFSLKFSCLDWAS